VCSTDRPSASLHCSHAIFKFDNFAQGISPFSPAGNSVSKYRPDVDYYDDTLKRRFGSCEKSKNESMITQSKIAGKGQKDP
jgi:hypothetical protein